MKATVLLPFLAACGTSIDPAGLPSVVDYHSWGLQREESTDIPGHPDSVRKIYVNDVAKQYPGGGRYPIGTVIVKDVLEKDGSLRYIAIMRKLTPGADYPTNEDWLFTDKGTAEAEETQRDLCWETCHRAGPYDGAWFDYSRRD